MASPKVFSMQGALDVAIFDLTTGLLDAYLEDCTTTPIVMSAERVYTMGKNGAYIIGFGHSRRAATTITHGYPTSDILTLQSGQDVVIGENTNAMKYEILTVTTDTATTSFTALGDVGSEIGSIWTVDSNGVPVKEYLQAAAVAADKFTYTSGTKLITFNTSDIADDTEIRVVYTHTTDATAQTIKFDSDVFAGTKKIVYTGIAKDNCSGATYKAQVIYYKADIGDNFTYDFTDTGDPIVQTLDIQALKPCGSKTMVEWIIYDESLAS